MTNFDIFAANPQFESFASVAVSAERILHIDPSACVLNCRRAMEFAVKWMYSVDKALVMPYQDSLVSLMNTEDFRDIVGTHRPSRRAAADLCAKAPRPVRIQDPQAVYRHHAHRCGLDGEQGLAE